jgi:hypothetical protein
VVPVAAAEPFIPAMAPPPDPSATRHSEEEPLPKIRPDQAAALPEPPKRYLTATAAAAAAPWSPGSATPPPSAAAAAARMPSGAPAELPAVPSGTFQGTLDVMDLADLTQAIAMGGKTGRLILALRNGGGLMAFESGRVVHAEYRGAVGEPAFAALLTAAHTDGGGRFCFLPSGTGEAVTPTRTIDKPVDRLLISIATAIDEKG